MTKNLPVKAKSILNTVGFYLLWLALGALGIGVAFQLQVTLLYLGILVVQNPSLRPPGWNTSTVSGINRCGYLLIGILWLGFFFYLERYLGTGLAEGKLLVRALRAGVALGITYLFCVALLYGLG